MSKLIDLTGQRFGRLVVIERAENDKSGNVRWVCRCDCGKTITTNGWSLRNGATKSCGCLRRTAVTTHGLSHTRLYCIWTSMKNRCYDPNMRFYKDYGGRGIVVCDEWRKNFIAFYNWAMSHGYREDLTLDRIDNDGPYSPENCRWATRKEQANNRRGGTKVTLHGQTRSILEWCGFFKIEYHVVRMRINSGWPIERALMTPVRPCRKSRK